MSVGCCICYILNSGWCINIFKKMCRFVFFSLNKLSESSPFWVENVRQLEKGPPLPVVAVVTIIRCASFGVVPLTKLVFRHASVSSTYPCKLVSQSHFRISNLWSAMVAQIKKNKKTKSIYFRILLLGGPSPPSQLVPNPFNWSPNTVFLQISAILHFCTWRIFSQSVFLTES